jgi:hypothetical protein
MNRRTFIATTAAGVAVVACSPMKLLNLPELGIVQGGQLVLIEPPDPAVQSAINVVVPDTYAFELISVFFALACSAAVANRGPLLTLGRPGVQYANIQSSATVAASTNNTVTWARGITTFSAISGVCVVQMPQLILPPGSVITASAANLAAGDQISACRVTGIAWPLR